VAIRLALVSLAAAAKHPDMVQGVVMMSLLIIGGRAIPEFLRPVVAAIKSLIASPPVLQTLFRVVRRPGEAPLVNALLP